MRNGLKFGVLGVAAGVIFGATSMFWAMPHLYESPRSARFLKALEACPQKFQRDGLPSECLRHLTVEFPGYALLVVLLDGYAELAVAKAPADTKAALQRQWSDLVVKTGASIRDAEWPVYRWESTPVLKMKDAASRDGLNALLAKHKATAEI